MLKQVIGLFAYTEKKKKFQFHHFNTKNKVKIVQNCCVNYPLFFWLFHMFVYFSLKIGL